MAGLIKGNQYAKVAAGAPLVAVTYAALAYSIATVGCTPRLVDVEFFGVRVTFFFLCALSLAALILILFAATNVIRLWRVLRRRHRGAEVTTGRQFGAVGLMLALVAFGVTACLGLHFFYASCS